MTNTSSRHCVECGMLVDSADTYHPYAACLMFKSCHDGNVVQANLDGVRANGAQWEAEAQAEIVRQLRSQLTARDDLLRRYQSLQHNSPPNALEVLDALDAERDALLAKGETK